ncbi:MAG TPA: DUF4412 domain-containing protein [Candidatus Binatia bacterium]|jgi:hypothetical protein|nr:DUF4412 domain-containing protein [Candidatus Binatia bacterium]
MKTQSVIILTASLCLGFLSAQAQFGPRGGMGGATAGPRFSGSTARLFGDNSSFSATMEMQTKGASADDAMTMPGKISFDQGKSRFEMDLTQMKSDKMRPEAAAQMKSMGMDKMITISRPDKKVSYLIYPGMQAYAETPLQDPSAGAAASDFKFETTELGKETVDGHDCVKNKAVVTDKEGNLHESIIWNATDLKKFPVKIEQAEQGTAVTMLFKDVKLSGPEASLFEPPSDFTKYDSMQTMMQQQMMKRFGAGAGGFPPPRPPRSQ